MLGRMHILEAPGPGGEVGHGFFRDMRRVVIQDHANSGLQWVIRIEGTQQGNEFTASMPVFHVGQHVPRMQIDTGQNRYRAMPHILVVPTHGRSLAGTGGKSGAVRPSA